MTAQWRTGTRRRRPEGAERSYIVHWTVSVIHRSVCALKGGRYRTNPHTCIMPCGKHSREPSGRGETTRDRSRALRPDRAYTNVRPRDLSMYILRVYIYPPRGARPIASQRSSRSGSSTSMMLDRKASLAERLVPSGSCLPLRRPYTHESGPVSKTVGTSVCA